MFKFKRLFWRIFIAFWLANIMALVATAVLIIGAMESDNFKRKHHEKMQRIAHQIVEHYESNGFDHLNQEKNHEHHFLHKIHKRQPLRIFENEKVIYQHRDKKLKPENTIELQVKRDSGKTYRIQTVKGAPPRFIIDTIKKLNTVQFISICLTSMIVSFLLSWHITKPLKKLGRFSREYANGNNANAGKNVSIDESLLARGDEIGMLARDFDYMTKEVETSMQTQKQLLHDVSHELRAPLARLQAATGLIQQTQENNKYTDRIHSECERMDQLIQQILDYSRIDQLAIELQKVNITTLINEVVEAARFENDARDIQFQSSIDTELLCHPELLRRALENLIRNACKYTPNDSPIEIYAGQEENAFNICVRDHGPGIPESDITQILQPFYRAGNQMHTDGFGLGLSIAQRAMNKQNGAIRLKNHKEGGLLACLALDTN